MAVLYFICGAVWLVFMGIYINDLLRLQFWIGFVALIGLLP
jgi:hypothetical protein